MATDSSGFSVFRYSATRNEYAVQHRSLPDGFLIQNAQNRESSALQFKLDELIRVTQARNKMIGIERLSDEDLNEVKAEMNSGAAKDGNQTLPQVSTD